MGVQTIDSPRAELSEKEREILSLVAEGKPARQIAEELFCSKRTVEFHIRKAYRKLGVSNRIHAILTANLI